jgi:Xaa-Pro aminopeptidase
MPLNKDRAFAIMRSRGIDALVASSTENVYYVSDYWSLRQQLMCGTQAYALLPLNGEPAIVAPIDEADLVVNSDTWIKDVRFYGVPGVEMVQAGDVQEETQRLMEMYSGAHPEADALAALTKCISERGLATGTIALDTSCMPHDLFDAIRGAISNAKIVDGADLLREVRLIKTLDEVERIQRATEITEKSMEDALEIVRPDIMELDLAGMFEYSVAYDGGRVTYNLIGFRDRSAFPNPIPSSFAAHRGDPIRMTLGCTWQHYHSNISRTGVIGRPMPELKKQWQAVADAQEEAFGAIKPGAKLSDVYAAVDKRLTAAKLKHRGVSYGHGLGVECNEPPWIQAKNETELEEGMVINVDVGHFELGSQGVQIEDTVIVTAKGLRRLTRTDRDLYIL